MDERCAGCGGPASLAVCRARFDAYVGRDFADPAYFRSHRLLVDVYALQHPDAFCRSAKSLAAHLYGLALAIEGEADPAHGLRRLRAWLDGPRVLERPEPPVLRGAITLHDLPADASADVWREAVMAWARSAWAAYAPLHDQARAWIGQTLAD
jgi:hypothetical protein